MSVNVCLLCINRLLVVSTIFLTLINASHDGISHTQSCWLEKKDFLMKREKEKNSKVKDHWLHHPTAAADGVIACAGRLQRLFDLDDLGDAIVHFLDGLEFGQAHATLVGDVINASLSFGVLAAGSAHLQVVLSSDLLETSVVASQLWYLDVH